VCVLSLLSCGIVVFPRRKAIPVFERDPLPLQGSLSPSRLPLLAPDRA